MSLTIIGLGPGSIEDLSLKAWRKLESAEHVYLRTERHPCVLDLPKEPRYESFDHLYESHEKFEDVYAAIVAHLLEAAKEGEIIYAVPGDPLVGESTTKQLIPAAREQGITLEIINGISFIEPMLRTLGIDAFDGLQILDAMEIAVMHHPPINPEYPALIGQVYSRQVANDLKLVLMNQYPDEFNVTLIHGAGTGEESLETLPLYEIDRSERINHLSSLYLPAKGKLSSFESFQEVIAHLRAPEGCPWDRKQTHESLRPYLIEEAYEVLETIENEDWDSLAGELGDLLLQIVLHTQIATEYGEFYMTDVLEHVNQKMIRRHPHVWGDVQVNGDAGQVVANWEEIKKAEKNAQEERKSLLDGLPKGLPALMVAHKYQEKAAKVGFDWPDVSGVEAKVHEELAEIIAENEPDKKAHEIVDLIFVLVNWLRWLGIEDSESLMREVNAKFYRRFTYIEENATKPLKEMSLEELDSYWNEAKKQGL
jgi:tetrapyrrole methylase family protein / MazG family protein